MGKESRDSCDFEPNIDPQTGGGNRDAGVVEGVAVLVYNRTTNIDRKKNPGTKTGITK